MLLLIDNYDSFTYNLYQYLSELGQDVRVFRNDKITLEQIEALKPERIVISPGPSTPQNAGISNDVIRHFGPRIPVLGVCLGHQCIGYVYGARVERAGEIVHGKSSLIFHDGKGIFEGIANPFSAIRYHSLAVMPQDFPDVLEVTARTRNGLIMGIRHREYPVTGIQFHPESIKTEVGKVLLANFLHGGKPRGIIREAISLVIEGKSLSKEQASGVMTEIMEGSATPAQIGSFITALCHKGETVEEIAGLAQVMREKATRISVNGMLVDTCGTGGDTLATFNISTAAAFVTAGAGLKVAKHGNRAMSSRCGSADVMEALGVKIDMPPADVKRCLEEIGIGFMFAPLFHPAMKYAAAPRKEIGIRTVFNILGPLTNPAGAQAQVIGVPDIDLTLKMAQVLRQLGAHHVLVVHGEDGLDEFSISVKTDVCELKDGNINSYSVAPEDFGLERASLESIRGGTAEENAARLCAILKGERSPLRDAVLMYAAAALVAGDKVENLAEGVLLAGRAIDDGSALKKLEQLVEFSKSISCLVQ